MGKLLRRLIPLAAVFAWRNRDQLADWYQKRGESNDDATPVPKTQIAPIPADDAQPEPTPVTGTTATTN